MTTPHSWYGCEECGSLHGLFSFYNPNSVYCENCGTQVGETNQDVEETLVAFVKGNIVNAETGEELASVEFYDDKVEELEEIEE